MYVSVTKARSKRGSTWQYTKKSRALKNPKIIRGETYPWTINGRTSVKEPYVQGEPISREPRPSFNLRLCESYRQDGKVKSRQKHLASFSEWDIVDAFMDSESFETHYQTAYCLDYEWTEKKTKEVFPTVDIQVVWGMIQDKMTSIEDPIIDHFKKSEEYLWWRKTLSLKNKLKAEQERKQQEKRQQESQYQYQQYHSNTTVAPPTGLTISEDEAGIIKKCYRSMAVALHPDKGGSDTDMALLNNLMDRIKKL